MNNRSSVNFIYYGLFFLLLCFIQVHHFQMVMDPSLGTRLFFLAYSIGQVVIEVIALVFIGVALRRVSQKMYKGFVSVVFVLFLVHVVDYILVSLMDMTFWYTISMVLDETLDNFLEMLYLSGIPMWVWALLLPIAIGVPIFGALFYKFSQRVCQKSRANMNPRHLSKAFLGFPIALLLLDLIISPSLLPDDYEKFEKTLPWKSTFIVPKHQRLSMDRPMAKSKIHNTSEIAIEAKHTPNIFLFVSESLREDYITPQTAPHLSAFKQEHGSFSETYSNANATQQSWFSIFHARLPFYWTDEPGSEGSEPLQLLKKGGYKIHLYSSAQLKYYNMDEKLFGKNQKLLDSKALFPHDWEREAWEGDEQSIEALISDVRSFGEEGGHVFLIFLDSTHFNYSWPNTKSIFNPYLEEMTNFRVSNSIKNIEGIKNRYRNSIHFVDELFGRVTKELKTLHQYEDAAIIFTGDHGEEFLEQGHLFHASHLASEQLKTPIYFKFGKQVFGSDSRRMLSHVDIFPSVLDYVFTDYPKTWFDGRSIFSPEWSPFVLSTRYNGSRAPYEFSLRRKGESITMKFIQTKGIFQAKEIEIISNKNKRDAQLINRVYVPYLEILFKSKISITN